MVKEDTHPRAREVILEGKNGEAFLLIHGYTGSPTDFNGLPNFLHERKGFSVFVPLLPGHGTRVEDLRGLTKDDFIAAIEEKLKILLSQYEKVIIGGHSFGGQVALILAAKYPVHGIFVTAVPFRAVFPLSLPGLYRIWQIFSRPEFLKKRWTEKEKLARIKADAFSYLYMPAYGLKIVTDTNEDLRACLPDIKSPILSVYMRGDNIANSSSGEAIDLFVGSQRKKTLVFDSLIHGAFFSEHIEEIYKEIVDFFRL